MEEFIVSARKYRPLTFDSVVGQSHITTTLRNSILRDQLAHAFLFCGPRGVGKTTCARIMAKAINCTSIKEGAEPCDECESCRAFNSNSSFNIHEMDAASNNSVDDIRKLTEIVRIPPQIGKYSVYIVDEVHMLSAAAFNAFLKTLEEPPKHAKFILATTEKHKILPTVLSRCQTYDFRRIRVEDIVGQLMMISQNENITGDDESYHMIAQKSEGCMRDALSLFDKVVSFSGSQLHIQNTAFAINVLDYDSYFLFIDYLKVGDFVSALLLLDSIMQRGFEAATFLAGLSSHLRDVLMARDTITVSLLDASGTLLDRYIGVASGLELPFIYRLIDLVTQTEQQLKTSLNKRLTVELMVMKGANLSGVIAPPPSMESMVLPAVVVNSSPDVAVTIGSSVGVNNAITSVDNIKDQEIVNVESTSTQSLQSSEPVTESTLVDSGVVVAPSSHEPIIESVTMQESVPNVVDYNSQELQVDTKTDSLQNHGDELSIVEQSSVVEHPAIDTEDIVEDVNELVSLSAEPAPVQNQEKPQTVSATPSGMGLSSLGISIGSIMEQGNTVKQTNDIVEKDQVPEVVVQNTPMSNEELREGCMRYVESIKNSKPRFYSIFASANFVDGRIVLTVPNQILAEEFAQSKSDLVRELTPFFGGKYVDIVIELVEFTPENENLLIKDEDKISYMIEQNGLVSELCNGLKLDFN